MIVNNLRRVLIRAIEKDSGSGIFRKHHGSFALRDERPSPSPAHGSPSSHFLSLPDPSAKSVKGLLLEIENDEQYCDFLENHAGPGPRHQILGWPQVIQDEMELECQLVTNGLYTGNATGYKDPRRKELEPGADDWTLLLQIDSDDNTRMMWGDAGMLYVWIRRQDLASRNFDKAWTILQCF